MTTTVRTGGSEAFVLPLSGGAVTVEVTGESGQPLAELALAGRQSVFAAVSDFAYVGRDSVLSLTSETGAEIAIPASRCTQ